MGLAGGGGGMLHVSDCFTFSQKVNQKNYYVVGYLGNTCGSPHSDAPNTYFGYIYDYIAKNQSHIYEVDVNINYWDHISILPYFWETTILLNSQNQIIPM